VFADETRPLLQGARLTAWELKSAGIPVTVICDNMAGQVMREGRVQLVIVGADRIASNGDTANKIGTYSVAVLAKAHGVPFYVAAPTSTIDHAIATGSEIPIEVRARDEIASGLGRVTVPDGVDVYNPAFDVTPSQIISGIITERGIHRPPFNSSLPRDASRAAQGVR
jgi:methylthioribose-1-phosphate isomerase